MYRRLEPKAAKMEATEKISEDICVCVCKGVQSKDAPPQPESLHAGEELATDFRING